MRSNPAQAQRGTSRQTHLEEDSHQEAEEAPEPIEIRIPTPEATRNPKPIRRDPEADAVISDIRHLFPETIEDRVCSRPSMHFSHSLCLPR